MKDTVTFCTVLVLFAVLMPIVAFGGEWKAAEQPDLAKKIAAAPKLNVENLGAPVKTARMDRLLYAPNPDGKSYDLIQIYFKHYGGPNTIVIMDIGSGEVKQLQIPRSPHRYQFHLCPAVLAPNGKLYISITTSGRRKICIYDPATNNLKIDALEMPDSLRGPSNRMVLGTDGKLYCSGGHPTRAATACQIDPATGKVTGYGAIGPSHAPDNVWAYSIAADNRYIYIVSGKIPWYLVAYDRKTGKSKVLVTTETEGGFVGVRQGDYGCRGFAWKIVGTDGKRIDYWLHEGKAIPIKDAKESPPWREPQGSPPLIDVPARPEVSRAGGVPDDKGNAEIWYRTAEAKAKAPANAPADTPPEKLGWKAFRFNVPIYPQSIIRLTELPDGKILGTAGSYEGCFIYDPAAGQSKHLGKFRLSHYATAIHDGKVYMSGYPTSPLLVYDPSKPWTALKRLSATEMLMDDDPRSNPCMVTRLVQAGTHKMYAAAVGANGKIYFGGRWWRKGKGGGLAWWNPKTQKADGIWKPFSNYQINSIAAADDGKVIVISTLSVLDTVLGKPTPEQAALFFFDTTEEKITGKLEVVPSAKGTGFIVAVAGGRVFGWTVNPGNKETSIMYGVDVRARKVAFRKTIPFPLPVQIGSNQREGWDFRLGPDGMIWTFIGKHVLVRIDPSDASIHPVGRVSVGGRIAFSGKDIYLGGTENLRRIKAVSDLNTARDMK